MKRKKQTKFNRKKTRKYPNHNKHVKQTKKNERIVVVGTYEKSRNFGFVVPDGKKVETDIFISKKNTMSAKNGYKVVVELTKQPINKKKAEGKIIEVLGDPKKQGIDILCIIKEFEIANRFSNEIRQEVKMIRQTVDPSDIPNRMDFRDINIYTIDGEDAKDLDDAISIQRTQDGNFVLGVHIADVSHYVVEGSKLDKEASARGTSVYLLDKVIPMLPFELSNGICSLNAGQDRFTLSIIMEIDKNGQVINSYISKGIINVKERMSYTDIQKILDKSDKKVMQRYVEDIEAFKQMQELAYILKERRKNQGSLDLDLPETKIILDEQGKPIEVKQYPHCFANEIIEQFMLTANEEIAFTFNELNAPFIYRVHEEPDIEKVKELNKFLFNFGYKVNIDNDKISPKELARILDEIKGKPEEKLISKLILRTLRLAVYEAENKGHFGIASKYYCHFTSPIRRYPDLFIHRVISEYVKNNNKVGPKKRNRWKEQAQRFSEISSTRERNAQLAEREAESMKMAEFMEDKIGELFDGVISSVTSFGVFVELPNTIEGLIRFDDLGKDYYIYDEDNKYLIGRHTKEIFRIGDKIKVKLIKASKDLRRIDFQRVEE